MNISELAKFRGGVSVDTISELSSASGVTVDGVLLKDSAVSAASGVSTNTITEYSSGSGVTIDSMLIKDGKTSSNNIDWQEPTMFRNRIINGGFGISQRGASITSIAADFTYTADRWYVARGGNLDYAQRAVGSYNPPAGFYYYGEFINKSAGNPFISIGQPIETINCYDLAGKSVTLSFWARAAANTAASKALSVYYRWSASVDTKGGTEVALGTPTLTYGTAATDWTKNTYTFTVPATAKALDIYFALGTTLAVNDGFHFTGVQLEPGSIATPFEFRPYGTELALCMRYYEAVTSFETGLFWSGNTTSGSGYYQNIRWIVPKRSASSQTVTIVNEDSNNFGGIIVNDKTLWGFRASATANATSSGSYFRSGYICSDEL